MAANAQVHTSKKEKEKRKKEEIELKGRRREAGQESHQASTQQVFKRDT